MSFRIYVIGVLAAFLGLSGGYQLYWRAARLSCWGGGYAQDAWLAYCNSDRYGVYDVDAVWFETEAEIATRIRGARVLTLSDSRMQNALSIGGASDWFAARDIPVYFLGLPTEESGFGEKLWEKFKPQARVVIFDASPYFTGRLGPIEDAVFGDTTTHLEQLTKLQNFQKFHRTFCGKFSAFCTQNFAYYRARVDGHWIFPAPGFEPLIGRSNVPNERTHFAIDSVPNEIASKYPDYYEAALSFIAKIDLPRSCIVITHVPSEDSIDDLAPYLAQRLGATLIEPKLPGLTTFDRAHLTPRSSVEWTRAFLTQLQPILETCNPTG